MPRSRAALAIFAALLSIALPARADDDLGVRVPSGFEVSLYADDTLAHDIYSMTIDAQGRVVVAGAGYVRILHDTDNDGRADRASLFSNVPASGAHGMYFDGADLICTGDNAVMRLRDADRNGGADGAPEVWTALRHPEHGANGLVRGPDGCYYLICGNDAGISTAQISTAQSPVAHPHSGGVVRFSPQGKPLDIFAHGFRNPYDLDFDAAGHLLTVDSDGERDHHLPWYAPTRLFDIAQGMEHGWLLKGWTRGWNRPESFVDNVERMVEIGRGSPTGLTVYRHRSFPEHYRGGVFSACWTLGRIYYLPLEASGATCTSSAEVFLQTTGDVGFAPCDLAVGPQGDLFVAIGGRRTRGSVFRVRSTGGAPAPPAPPSEPLLQVLEADQPLASWSRAQWVPQARQLGKEAFERAFDNPAVKIAAQVRAVEVLVELFGGVSPELAERAASFAAPVRARLAWAISRGPDAARLRVVLARLTTDHEPSVERAAWESLATYGEFDPQLAQQPDWGRGLVSPVRRVRTAAILAARGAAAASYRQYLAAAGQPRDPTLRLASIRIKLPEADPESAPRFTSHDFNACLRAFESAGANVPQRLEALRLLQIGLGDVRVDDSQVEAYAGYMSGQGAKLDTAARTALVGPSAPLFPTTDAEVNRELARLLGMLHADNPALLSAIARQWSTRSTVEDDIHYLIVLSLLEGSRSPDVTARTATCLLLLHKKLDDLSQFTSRNWPQRIGEIVDELLKKDPALADAIVANERFGHPEQTVFAERLPQAARQAATRRLWQEIVDEDHDAATSDLIALVARLPAEESQPLLRSQWENVGLRDSIVVALAKHPQVEDRAKYIEALSSPQAGVVERVAKALVHLGMDATSAELGHAVRALKRACAAPKQDEPRRSLVKLLNFWTEENSDVDEDPDPSKVYLGWYQLMADYYPHEAEQLKARSSLDTADWKRRLAQVNWPDGDVGRGKAVFELRACHRCHTAGGHLGPELKGAVSRLSRDDLFTAILDPNLEVSPAFQTTLIATDSGQVYHGLVVYESPEATLLQTGPDTTVRIMNTETSSMVPSKVSLMPTGLLDTLTDQDLSDLYAYLKTLGAK